jgi:hypothetical protein
MQIILDRYQQIIIIFIWIFVTGRLPDFLVCFLMYTLLFV